MEIDISEGLEEFLDIDWGGWIVEQRSYYLHDPFRCHFCRAMGHLLDAWNFLFGGSRSYVTPDARSVDGGSSTNSQKKKMLIGADAQTLSTQNATNVFPFLESVYVELATVYFDTIDDLA